MTNYKVRVATEAEAERVIDVFVLAFSTDPAARWSWPDPHGFLTHFRELVKALGGKAFAQKSVHYVEGYSGAALWLPPNVQPDNDAITALFQRSAPKEIQDDIEKVFEKMGGYHPHEPHWYLPFLGVDPFLQGNGIGSALLKHALVSCDREGQFAYLDSSNPRNVPLYERHGFEVLGEIQEGTSPTIFPMLRRPRGVADV